MKWLNHSSFVMGGILWHVVIVPPDSCELVNRTNTATVATTDPATHTVYLSESLSGEFLARVFIHELGHCAMVSFGLIDEIRRLVPPTNWVEMEEFCCNFIADYGYEIYSDAYYVLGDAAIHIVPGYIERFIA